MTDSAPLGDLIQPFQVERYGLRGRLVRLGAVADDVLGRHDYPEPVAGMLGQMMAIAAALAGALKYEGVFTLQTQGNGPIRLMVADVTSNGDMRAYAQFDAAEVAHLEALGTGGISVPQWLGAGHLAFTVDQGPDTERYQGIVELDGMTLAECVHHYFRQSEQIDAALKVAIEHVPGEAAQGGGWRVGALMIQRVPKTGGVDDEGAPMPASLLDDDEREEGWREAIILMGSATSDELTGGDVAPDKLLYRLFHEPGVRVFKTMRLQSACRCSQDRVVTMLRSFPKDQIADMMVDGHVDVTCEFCRRNYRFDQALLDSLYAEEGSAG
ncbi:MAG TPA: Hsp33 family molecular chaperone HslO [Alphaproteobacteria bacterium]|jgi:molecular chaperone Hsp33